MDYDVGKTYDDWLLDGRRSKEQINEVKNKLEQAKKYERIGDQEYQRLDGIVKKAEQKLA
ncbi:hypothetical protein [Fuchsiella alkaliacetigena]|uniref:hypothetical protein n=1 Tax=Fuchsiella alkaliacetigena TaxID=957042 RepID=UPI00200A377D|nr:hypothetical protein [Fuchsiella alkaliacetigena]MCK8824723.1 hypothetical protein [Fuchsiella alkaliacetigena]